MIVHNICIDARVEEPMHNPARAPVPRGDVDVSTPEDVSLITMLDAAGPVDGSACAELVEERKRVRTEDRCKRRCRFKKALHDNDYERPARSTFRKYFRHNADINGDGV